MKERLNDFLRAENITQSQFADNIKVARASVSNAITGRTNPSCDFICNVMKRYPNLNIEWLLMGAGKMYKNPGADSPSETKYHETEKLESRQNLEIATDEHLLGENLFSQNVDSSQMEENSLSDDKIEQNTQISQTNNEVPANAKSSDNQRSVSRIILFYSDNTFQEIQL